MTAFSKTILGKILNFGADALGVATVGIPLGGATSVLDDSIQSLVTGSSSDAISAEIDAGKEAATAGLQAATIAKNTGGKLTVTSATSSITTIIAWVKNNPLIAGGFAIGLFLLYKVLHKKRR